MHLSICIPSIELMATTARSAELLFDWVGSEMTGTEDEELVGAREAVEEAEEEAEAATLTEESLVTHRDISSMSETEKPAS